MLKHRLRPLVGSRFQVLFHSPHRGAFHRSLTVLFAIGSYLVFSLGRWSSQLQAGFLVSRPTQGSYSQSCACRLRDFHPLRSPFPVAFGYTLDLSLRGATCIAPRTALQPRLHNTARFTRRRFGLFPFRSPLLRESHLISVPSGT